MHASCLFSENLIVRISAVIYMNACVTLVFMGGSGITWGSAVMKLLSFGHDTCCHVYEWIRHVFLGGSGIIRIGVVIYMDESCLSRWELDYQEKCCRKCMRRVFLGEIGFIRTGAVMYMKESCLSGWEWEHEDTCYGVWGYVLHVQEMCALPPRALYMNECRMSLEVGAGWWRSVLSCTSMSHVSSGARRIIRIGVVIYMNCSCLSRWEQDYQDKCCHVYEWVMFL